MTVERPVLFGPGAALMGILSLPEPESADSSDVCILLFNAGVVSRMGPHRINVKIARLLSKYGVPTLRFDLAGHGDSRTAANGNGYRNQAVADLSEAMDCVQRELGISKFMLIGICSGAMHAFRAAEVDRRVVGVLLFDGHWYRTIWTKPVRHWKQFRAVGLVRTVKSVFRRIIDRRGRATGGSIDDNGWTGQPTKGEYVDSLTKIIRRGVSVYIIYSELAIREGLYSYAAQFRHAFRGAAFVDAVRVDLRPDFDHTLTALASQRQFMAMVAEWTLGFLRESQNLK